MSITKLENKHYKLNFNFMLYDFFELKKYLFYYCIKNKKNKIFKIMKIYILSLFFLIYFGQKE